MEAVMIKPQVKVEDLGFNDPEFEAGSVHTAHATLSNPTDKEWTYALEFYLDVTQVAITTGEITIAANSSQPVDITITMPSAEGTYDVYLDVYVAGELIGHRVATEPVTIVISPAVDIGIITWE